MALRVILPVGILEYGNPADAVARARDLALALDDLSAAELAELGATVLALLLTGVELPAPVAAYARLAGITLTPIDDRGLTLIPGKPPTGPLESPDVTEHSVKSSGLSSGKSSRRSRDD